MIILFIRLGTLFFGFQREFLMNPHGLRETAEYVRLLRNKNPRGDPLFAKWGRPGIVRRSNAIIWYPMGNVDYGNSGRESSG